MQIFIILTILLISFYSLMAFRIEFSVAILLHLIKEPMRQCWKWWSPPDHGICKLSPLDWFGLSIKVKIRNLISNWMKLSDFCCFCRQQRQHFQLWWFLNPCKLPFGKYFLHSRYITNTNIHEKYFRKNKYNMKL